MWPEKAGKFNKWLDQFSGRRSDLRGESYLSGEKRGGRSEKKNRSLNRRIYTDVHNLKAFLRSNYYSAA
jgi:hypothetical protein